MLMYTATYCKYNSVVFPDGGHIGPKHVKDSDVLTFE
jgi:hypothetical protein